MGNNKKNTIVNGDDNDDIDYKSLYINSQRLVDEKNKEIEELMLNNKAQVVEIEKWKNRVIELLHLVYASKSERLRKMVVKLWNELPDDARKDIEESGFDAPLVRTEIVNSSKSRKKKVAHSNDTLEQRAPDRIVDVVGDKVCPKCGGLAVKIDFDKRKIANYIKILELIEYHIDVMKCKSCGLIFRPHVAGSLHNSMASSNTIAQIIFDRASGSPDNRLALSYDGLSRQTVTNWLHHGASIIHPLAERIGNHLQSLHVMHMDETRMPIIEFLKIGRKCSYLLTCVSGRYEKLKIVRFITSSSRGRESLMAVPRENKEDELFLMTDALSTYQSENNIKNANCFVHARRRLVELVKVGFKESFIDELLVLYSGLFHNEQLIKDFSTDERFKYRLKHSMPIVKKMLDILIANKNKYPGTKIDSAINYHLNNWEELTLFFEHGNIPIHNNDAESALRPYCVGRKNSLFANNLKSANRIADLYTIVQTAKVNKLQVIEYMAYVIEQLDDYKPKMNIDNLLPWNEKMQERFGKK